MEIVVQSGERRLARVESLRALAALGVLAGHAWGWAHAFGPTAIDSFPKRLIYGGGYGVFLFFALTGYLLFWPFVRHHFGDRAPVDLAAYARNRVLRILPLYLLAIVLLVLVFGKPGGWRALVGFQNFSEDTVGVGSAGVLWSVVVEVHFYLVLPLLAAGIAVVSRGSAVRAAAVVLGLGALSLAAFEVKVAGDASRVWRFNLPVAFMFFVPGMLLALLRLELERRRPRWLDGPAGSSAVWLVAGGLAWAFVLDRFDVEPLSTLAAFLTVGACVLPLRESRLRDVLEWRPLVAVGVVSFSLYVWHMTLQEGLADASDPRPEQYALQAAACLLALVVAFVSYRVVEAPFLALRRRWSPASAPMSG